MNIVLSFLLFIILYYVNNILEKFDTTETDVTTTSSNASSTTSSNASSTTRPEIKYFELNNESKNLVNNYKYETQLKEIANEEDNMRNNVRKIQNHAENVLDFTDLNKDYFEKILLDNSA